MKRDFPDFNFPLPRFKEQYERLVSLVKVAEQMKGYGVLVDTQRALTHAREADERAALFTQMFLELTKLKRTDLGLKGTGNSKAVKTWFREAGAPDVVFDKKNGKPQFNSVALTCWGSDYEGKEFSAPAAALLGLRKAKTAGTFAQNYYDVTAHSDDGRIHFDFNVMGTKGERWSASAKFIWEGQDGTRKVSLNAQNVPGKASYRDFGKYGKLPLQVSMRDCFIPDPGTTWCKFDFEGAEAAIITYLTRDATLLEWQAKGLDFHTENAKVMFKEAGIPADMRKIEKGSPWEAYRVAAKPTTFGLVYQMPIRGREDADLTEVYGELWKQWKQMFPNLNKEYFGLCIERYWEAHGGIRGWQYQECERVEDDGYITLPQTGKTLYVASTAKGKNMAANFYCQSGLGFLINRAIPSIAARCDWTPKGLALLLQVHDELDLQVPDDRVDDVCGWVSEEMSKPADFGGYVAGVPAAPDIGTNWGKLTPWNRNAVQPSPT